MDPTKASPPGRAVFLPNPKAGLFEQCREVLRFQHYALRTEEAYLQWIRRYLEFHRTADPTAPNRGWRHPKEMGPAQVREFLTHLAVHSDVAASTQNQALNALVFLYHEVLQSPLGDLGEVARVTRPARMPAVLTREETRRVLAALKPGTTSLVVRLLYGTGMRLLEALRLRVKDLDLARGRIIVREAKGDKDRVTMLPEKLELELRPKSTRT